MIRALLLSLISLVCMSDLTYAQDGAVIQRYRSFDGGLVDSVDASEIRENQSPDMLNMIVDDPRGSLTPRKGFEQCGVTPSGNAVTELAEYFRTNGTRELVVTDSSAAWTTTDCVTFTEIITDLQGTVVPDFAIVRDDLWLVNRTTHVIVWDGTTATTLDGRSATPSPAPPKGTYIEFWRERVWIARSVADPSGVAFSSLTNPEGDDITPSTGSVAWPATNIIQVAENSGGPIYGIKAYRDRLYVFKDKGIWRIIFNNDFDFALVRTLSSVGTRFDKSIVELDGLLYFVGPDGIYAFDGDRSTRISDNIKEKFESLAQPLVNDQVKRWTSNADFAAGTLVHVDSASITGSVLVGSTLAFNSTLSTGTIRVVSAGELFFSDGYTWGIPIITTETNDPWEFTTEDLRANQTGSAETVASSYVSEPNFNNQQGRQWEFSYLFVDAGAVGPRCTFMFISDSTNSISLSGYGVSLPLDGAALTPRIEELTAGSFSTIADAGGTITGNVVHDMKVSISSIGLMQLYIDDVFSSSGTDTTYTASEGVNLFCNRSGGTEEARFSKVKETIFYDTGTLTSDAFNAVTISTWGAFEVTEDQNGLARTFYVKVATAEGALPYKAFSSITPGSLISGATADTWIQWHIEAFADELASLELKDVAVNYSQGGVQSQTIYGSKRNNKYWVSATSGTDTSNNTVLQNTFFDKKAWTLHDLQLGPMTEFNDNFYAGASTHSGIYRMEFGTNDNGETIPYHWISREEMWGMPNRRKYLYTVNVDYRKDDATNMKVSFSREGGAYTDRTVDMSGTGRGSKKLNFNGGNGYSYQFKISNNTIDETARIMGLAAIAVPAKTFE